MKDAVTVPRTSRTKASRRRRRRVKTRYLVFVAVTACLAVLIVRGSQQVLSQVSCSDRPVYLNVAVSTDIAPAIQRIADVFNRQQHRADGQCIFAHVDAAPSWQTTGEIDGTHPEPGSTRIDAWIPDSSLWVDEARGFAVGATTVQPAGFSVAHSPLMIVMPSQATAAKVAAFGKVGWRLLLPQAAGGPAVPAGLRVDLPDPTQNAAGLATLIEISRLLGSGPSARVDFTKFVYSSQVTPDFGDPVSLKYFASLAAPPLDGLPVTVTSEQAVLGYDAASPSRPLAASYPTGPSSDLGSPELDYPYVTTTANPVRYAAAKVFGRALTRPFARSVIRYAGFRSGAGTGVPDKFPASYGLSSQLLQIAPPAAASEAPSALQVWNKLSLGSRFLTLVDVSATMGAPAEPTDPTGPTVEQVLTQTASLGLALFPDSASIGLWEFAADLNGRLPYKQLVPVGPLGTSLGVISRRTELQKINASIRPAGSPQLALYGSILAAYKYMERTYQKSYFNSVVVMTSGEESAPGDITAAELLKQHGKLANPDRKVPVVIIVFGNPLDYGELKQIAAATGGQTYQITNPSQVGKVFFRALAHRLCDPNCVAA